MGLKIIWNSIIDEPADVIVTPASRKPRIGTGLDKAIHEAAGPDLLTARKDLGVIEPGVVKVTKAYKLSKCKCHAKHVIHALGPYCDKTLNGTERPILIACYLQILCKAVKLKAKTVSIPVMSSGKFGMEMSAAMEAAVEAINCFLEAVPDLQVKLVGIDPEFYACAMDNYSRWFTARYDQARVDEYRKTHKRYRWEDGSNCGEAFDLDEKSDYFKHVKLKKVTEGNTFTQILRELWRVVRNKDRESWKKYCAKFDKKPDSSPGAYLLQYSDLSARSGVSERSIKRYFSVEERTIPPYETLLSILFAMRVPGAYGKALLLAAGYRIKGDELSVRERFLVDMLDKGVNWIEVDERLKAHRMKPLNP